MGQNLSKHQLLVGAGVGATALAVGGLVLWAHSHAPANKTEADKEPAETWETPLPAASDAASKTARGADGKSVAPKKASSEKELPKHTVTVVQPPSQQQQQQQEHKEAPAQPKSCCPADSLPPLREEEFKADPLLGRIVRIPLPVGPDGGEPETFEAYVVGQPKDGRCIIVAHDIYGFMSGRISTFCDEMAESGYLVIQPNFYGQLSWSKNRDDIPAFFRQFGFAEAGVADKVHATLDWAAQKGAQQDHIGMVGFCWGSYVVMHTSATNRIAAGASLHPSHTRVMGMLDEDPSELMYNLKCPQLVYTAGSDPEQDKPGGAHSKVIEDLFPEENDIREFPDMAHGWMSRGNPEKDRIYEAQEGILNFFQRML